jgi:hypothetical protein
MRVAVLDDVNGDGFEDAAIASWDDRAIVISGADGKQLWKRDVGGDVWAIERVEDVNGDGINDVVAGSFDHFVYMLDGVTGLPEWTFDTGNRLYFVTGTSDVTGNGIPDVFAGSQKLSGPGGHGFLLEGGEPSPTPAGLPMLVDGTASGRGIEVRLRNADAFSGAYVERLQGAGPAEAARRFRAEVAEAYLDGGLSAREAVQARSQDPEVTWTRLTPTPLAVRAGQATYVDATAVGERTYHYRFAFVSEGRIVGFSPTLTIEGTADGGFAIPEMTVRPNPLSSDALGIEFRLRETQTIHLAVYDAAGRRVAEVDHAERSAGSQFVAWDGRDASGRPLANGVYFLRLEGRDFVSTKKVTILR